MTAWSNIAGDLDDVMYVHSGYIYFFSNGSYYRFNCKTKMVNSGWPDQPNYPMMLLLGGSSAVPKELRLQ